MPLSWITLYPGWYVEERERLARHYRGFTVDEGRLRNGALVFYGQVVVRPGGGAARYPVQIAYPQATPYEPPVVIPLERLPAMSEEGVALEKAVPRFYDHRHQMPNGTLCLFQRETRGPQGDTIRGTDALRRAEKWFLGLHTGHWPPDSENSELESHFEYLTDALLGTAFYDVRPGQSGQFWLVPDLRRIAEGRTEVVYPYIATALTVESTGIVTVQDARADLRNLYPWIDAKAWDPYRLELPDEYKKLQETHGMERGFWWFLPEEPRPFHDGASLLRTLGAATAGEDAWDRLPSALKAEMATARKHFVGLCYPKRGGGVEWLVTIVLPSEQSRQEQMIVRSDAEKRRRFEQAQVLGVRVHTVRPADLNLRNTHVVAPGIAQKTVALIGLGALGSVVAELLAKAGVGRFLLWDGDTLKTGNVARHVGGLDEFGASKVQVVAHRLWEINPYLEFGQGDIVRASATASLDDLGEFIAKADLTISTTADESVEAVINQAAVMRGKPALYGRALRRGSMGRVFLVRPGEDACKQCLAEYARSGRSGGSVPAGWIEVPEDEKDAILHECGRPVIPASAVDLTFVAALTARVALDFVEGDPAASENHWLWTRHPAQDIDPRLDWAMSTLGLLLKPSAACPVCQEPEIRSVLLNAELRAEITSRTEASPLSETGGTLVGYVDDQRRAVVTRVIGPGPNATQKATLFARDVEYTQAELDRVAQELGAEGAYIGEWHSHLVPMPEPSPTDIWSLSGISAAPHYHTRCPIMIIAGLDTDAGTVARVKAWSFPVGGRVYDIECESQ